MKILDLGYRKLAIAFVITKAIFLAPFLEIVPCPRYGTRPDFSELFAHKLSHVLQFPGGLVPQFVVYLTDVGLHIIQFHGAVVGKVHEFPLPLSKSVVPVVFPLEAEGAEGFAFHVSIFARRDVIRKTDRVHRGRGPGLLNPHQLTYGSVQIVQTHHLVSSFSHGEGTGLTDQEGHPVPSIVDLGFCSTQWTAGTMSGLFRKYQPPIITGENDDSVFFETLLFDCLHQSTHRLIHQTKHVQVFRLVSALHLRSIDILFGRGVGRMDGTKSNVGEKRLLRTLLQVSLDKFGCLVDENHIIRRIIPAGIPFSIFCDD